METRIIWVIITVIIALVMLFNRKTRVTQILAAQLRVFWNAKTRKTSIWDSICFVVMPVIVAIIISFALGWEINSDTFTGILALILVLIATALEFMFLARRTESDNKVKKQVMDETFVSILTSNVLSLFTGNFINCCARSIWQHSQKDSNGMHIQRRAYDSYADLDDFEKDLCTVHWQWQNYLISQTQIFLCQTANFAF